ncbi:MAG: tetratricopeptide repeat protein [Lentisphaerae bacterium]|nr:tetratricopeptide repeat protein [Lentisphaerota bacterium]
MSGFRKKCWYIALSWCLVFAVTAAESLDSSPWKGWRKGYECYDKAGAFKEAGDLVQAAEFYRRARDYFAAIRKHFPDWNKSVVEGRVKLCENAMREVQTMTPVPAANVVQTTPREMPPVQPPRYQREYPPAVPTHNSTGSMPPRQDYPTYNPNYSGGYGSANAGGNSGRLYIEMQSEIDQYRQRLRNALMEIDSLQIKLRQSEARSRDIDGVLRDYRLLQEKYSLLEMQYKNALQRNISGDRERYENQIIALKQANDEAAKRIRELENTTQMKDQEYAVSRTEVLQLRDAQQKLNNENRRLQREIELLRNRSTQVEAAPGSTGDHAAQIAQLNSELARKDQRIERLMKLLSEDPGDKNSSNTALSAEIKRLQQEVDTLRSSAGQDNALRRQISDLTVAESTLKKQLADANELLKVRNKELKSMQQSDGKTQQKLLQAEAQVKNLQQRLAAAEKELKAFAARYSAIEKRHQDRLRADALNQEQLVKARQLAEKNLAGQQKEVVQLKSTLEQTRRELDEAQKLIKTSRSNVIELTAKQHSSEIELRKMAAVQKAYDELKNRFDLIKQASNSDVLTALNRIPGLEESLKRYEKENRSLLEEIGRLKKSVQSKSAAALPTIAGAEREKLETLLADARSAEARGNAEIAVWGYRQVLGRDPANYEASAKLGNIYLGAGKFDEAVKLLGSAYQKTPGNAKLLNSYARALIGKRNYDAALKLIAQYKKQHNKQLNDAMLLTEALAFSRSGQAAAAEKAFKAVLQQAPGNAEAAYELALMLSADEKRRKEAGEFYMLAKENGIGVDSYLEELLRSFSNHDTATRDFLLGNIREALLKGDTASAQWYMNEVSKMFAKDKAVTYMQYIMYIYDRQSGEVVKRLARANDADSKFLYALALLQSGNTAAADKAIKQLPALKKLPEAALLKAFIQKEITGGNQKNRPGYEVLLKKLNF